MAKKSKQFRVATEGATVDGRTIQRSWIEQMAEQYDANKYRATINLEHIRGIVPDSPFRNYGFVDALSAAENSDGKLELFAILSPTDELVSLTGKGQKVFTSIEVNPKFADSGKAYLVGLAITDNPASLGVEMLSFTAERPEASPLTHRKQAPGNHFSVGLETTLEFIDAPAFGQVLTRVRELFTQKRKHDDDRFADLVAAIEEVAEHGQTQSTAAASQFQRVDDEAMAAKTRTDDLARRLEVLEHAFATTAAPHQKRPRATGATEALTTF